MTPEEVLQLAPEGVRLPRGLVAEAVAAWRSPGRAYHSLSHLEATLTLAQDVSRRIGWTHPREVFLALLFHDAVYVPEARDNEEQSAVLAARLLREHGVEGSVDVRLVVDWIRLTARHGRLRAAEVDEETALLLDCDLAILGAAPGDFDAYEAGVAAEYAHLPPELYAAGRRAFIEALLATDRLFLSEHFHHLLEARARANLRRRLSSGG